MDGKTYLKRGGGGRNLEPEPQDKIKRAINRYVEPPECILCVVSVDIVEAGR